MNCPNCKRELGVGHGITKKGKTLYYCGKCYRELTGTRMRPRELDTGVIQVGDSVYKSQRG